MNQASLLFQLQTIDLEISRHRNRLEVINSQLIDDGILQQAFTQVHDSKLKLSIARQELKSLEETANETRIKIETCESSLYSGKINSPKELKDLEAEIQSLKRRLSSIDDQQLEVMTNIEGLESHHNLEIESSPPGKHKTASSRRNKVNYKKILNV
jgi:predicted  nucleic acid-binding Zn-ribbon protein